VELFGEPIGDVTDALADAYRLAISKLESSGPVTRRDKELVALRLMTLARQGVKKPDLLSEAALEHLRRKRGRSPKTFKAIRFTGVEPK
jgi:hypothetical protein